MNQWATGGGEGGTMVYEIDRGIVEKIIVLYCMLVLDILP